MLSPRKPSARPVVEALEPKLLYSADLGLCAFVPVANEALAHKAVLTQDVSATTTDAHQATQQAGTEIVFVDANVPDAQALTRDIQQQAAQGRAIEVVVIQNNEDGLACITQTLKDRHDIAAIHLIGHGESGDMQLGNVQLDAQTLLNRASDIAQWGTAMTAQGDILLYGCDVAQGGTGHALVQGLAALTGADVAASDDLTGAASLGGNWTLEDQTGHIDAALALSATMQSQYTGVLALATPSTKGTAIWTESGFTAPQQAAWDGLTQSSQTNTNLTATWMTMTSAESPTRNEAIIVGVDSSGVIRGEIWNGTQWNVLPTNPIATGTVSTRQGFAVAYEHNTGNAMLVWNNGTTLSYSVYNGSTWTTAATVSAYVGAAPQRMQIAANPKGNDMALVISDSKGDDYALIWNGSSWGHAVTLDTSGTGANDQLSTSVAYESQNGVAMVAYAKASNSSVFYRTYNGSVWGNETTGPTASGGNYPLYLNLASDPNSNRLALAMHAQKTTGGSVSNTASFAIWNGSSWGNQTNSGNYNTNTQAASNVAAAFESLSGDVLAIYGTTSANSSYLTLANGSSTWSSTATGPTAGYVRMFSDPYTDHIMVGVQTTGGVLTYTDWTGSAFGTSTSVATNTGVISPAFTWLWQTDLSGNKTNTLLLGGSAASSGWSGVNNVSAGEVLNFTDPNLQYGGTTSGTFSHFVDLSALGASGLDDMAMVSQDVTLAAGLTLHRGDVLFTTSGASTLTNADGSTTSANNSDLVVYRPSVSGRYDKGTFTVIAQNITAGLLGLGSADVRGLALVEQSTVVGDVTLSAGTILFTAGTGTAAADIQMYVPNGGLLGGLLTGNTSTLIRGSDANIGIGQAITGLEIVSTNTTLKNMALTAGTLLISLEGADTIGTNNLSVTTADVVVLAPTTTSVNGNASATATRLMRGSSVGASGAVFDSLALNLDAPPVITSNGGGATATVNVNENTTAVTTVTATDIDANPIGLSYSITGGADASLFQINASTGVLSFKNSPNFEAPTDANGDNHYEVTVSASDGTDADTQAISVAVQNVNEAPAITSDGGGLYSIITATDGNPAATTVHASDPDAGDVLTYTVSGTDAALFNIDANTGVLTFKAAPSYAAPADANGDNIYNLTLLATDAGGLSATQFAFVRVIPSSGTTNATPVITSNGGGATAALSINEEATAVTTVQATDADSNVLTYAIAGGADQALFAIDPLTGALTFLSAPIAATPTDADHNNIYEVTVSASDGNTADTQNLSISVLAYNKPPVNTLPATYDVSQNTTLPLTGLSVSDADAGSATITVNLGVQHGILFVLNNVSGGLTSSDIQYSSSSNSHVQLTGTMAAINTTLGTDGGLLYYPTTNYVGNDTLTMVSDDGGNTGVARSTPLTSDTDTALIKISASDIAPTLTPSAGSAGFSEHTTSVAIDPGLTLTDPDTTTFAGATVQITGAYVSTQDVLGFTSQGGITGSWDSSTGTLTLSGSDTQANYQSALQSITYDNTSQNPDTTTRTVTFSISDNSNTATASRDVTITPYNNPPVLTPGSTALSYTENGASTPVDPALTLTDVDNATFNGATISISNFAATQDILSFTNTANISSNWDSTSGILTLTGTDTTANYQAALRSVGYYNSSDNPSTTPRTVVFSVDDGNGPTTASQTINITAVNDAPAMAITGAALSYTENDAPKQIAPTLATYDPDNTSMASATVQITTGYVNGQDVLSFTNTANITATWDSATGQLTLSGTDTTAAYQAALHNVLYSNTSDNPDTTTRTVTFSVSDGALSGLATQNINITAVNDPPALTVSNTPLTYTEGDPATAIDANLIVTDVDNTTLTGATIGFTAGYAGSEDVLSFANQSGITGSWNANTQTLNLSGAASVAAYQAALRSVTYQNTSNNPATLSRTLTIGVNDGAAVTTASRDITVNAVNNAPTLTNNGSALNYTENDAPTAIAASLTLSDPDSVNMASATVQITGHFVTGEDVLSFTDQSGITGTWHADTGTLALTGSASTASYQAALRAISYSNTSNNPDTTGRAVTFTVSDGNASATATQTIAITAVDDAPVVTLNSLSIQQGATATPQIQLSDPDNNVATLSITASGITGGHFIDDRTSTVVTQFIYSDVQGGHIQFVHDASATAPSFVLTASDGTLSSAPSTAQVQFTPLPTTAAPPAPPPEPPKATTSTPTEAPAPAPAAKETVATPGVLAQMPAPAQGTIYVPEPSPANVFEQDTRLPVATVKPVVDVQVRPTASGAEAIAPAPVVTEGFQFSWTTNLQTTAATEDLRRNLEALRDQLQDQGVERHHVVASSIALTTGLSVGYVIWLVRGGALLGSMLSAMPAWQMIDPLPVLTRSRARNTGQSASDEDQSVEQLFDDDHDGTDKWAIQPKPAAPDADMHTASDGVEPEVHT